MSVQLIIYPQSYLGIVNAISSSGQEFIVDGISFNTMNAASSYTSSTFNIPNLLLAAPPAIANTWYRWKYPDPTPIAFPTQSGGNVLFQGGVGARSGMYQKLTNLIIGQSYTYTVETAFEGGVAAGEGTAAIFDVNGGVYFTIGATVNTITGADITGSFTATATSLIFFFAYRNTTLVERVDAITNISVMPEAVTSTISNIGAGQEICDLYEDEDIPLTLSVDDFKNIAEQVQSYSKAFKLPGTKHNNKIFNALYEITRTAQNTIEFNPYVKTKCVLKQDGLLLFEGYLKMIDIQEKGGEISYNINLYSEVVALVDVLGERTFSELDFSELEHDYNKTEIKYSWNDGVTAGQATPITWANSGTSGFRTNFNTLKYPFVDWNHQFLIGGMGGSVDAIDDMPELTSLEQAFRPFISVKYCIERIFDATPFSFTSTFFDTGEFENLFMDFNWGADANPNTTETTGMATYNANEPDVYAASTYSNFNFNDVNLPTTAGYDSSTNIFTCPAGQSNSTFDINCRAMVIAKRDAEVDFRWVKNLGLATEVVVDQSPIISLEGSAVATVTYTVTGSVDTITIIDGGYYTAPPTVTIVPTFFGAGASFITTIDGSGAVDSITIDTPGGSYFISDELVFNGINPTYTYFGPISVPMEPADTLQLQWKSSDANYIRQMNAPWHNNLVTPNPYSRIVASVTVVGITSGVLLQTLRGELGQWDFLKGIMTMFNLVSIPDKSDPNNILIEPWVDVFGKTDNAFGSTLAEREIQLDWTNKIDVSEMKLTPLTDLNKKTIFKFVEDEDDYAANTYKNAAGGWLYGEERIDSASFAGNGLQTLLEGEKEVIAEPFAATVVKQLSNLFPDFVVPSLYSYNPDDGTSEGFDNEPRIMYNNRQKVLGFTTYFIPAQNGVAFENANTFLQFSHLTTIPTGLGTKDFLFASKQLFPGVGSPPVDNLFNLYWLPYLAELYNPDTRTMTIKVNLTPADISTFDFSYTVYIKNREFRVNKIDYKPNDLATVEFILIP